MKHPILIVWFKEIKETLRDRRTLLVMVLLPMVMMPGLMLGLPLLLMGQYESIEEAPVRVAVSGSSHGEAFMEYLKTRPEIKLVEVEDPRTSLEEREIDVLLEIPANFQDSISQGDATYLSLGFDSTRDRSRMGAERLSRFVDIYRQSIRDLRLQDKGITPQMLEPFHVQRQDLAPEARVQGMFMAMILPMVIGIWAGIGGMYTAIDVAAGEKERASLEPLLTTPPARKMMVYGKFLSILTVALVTVTIVVVSMTATFNFGFPRLIGDAMGEMGITLSLGAGMLIILVAFLLSAVLAALELTLSIFARSFKEAQNYITPLTLFIVFPAMIVQMLPELDASYRILAIPVFNCIVLIRDILLGEINMAFLGFTLIVSFVYAFLALQLAQYFFSREDVILKV